MALRLCLGWNRELCNEVVREPGNRCDAHRREYEAWRTRNRPGARERGYDAEHERNRAYLLGISTRCWRCGHGGADQADHIIPRSLGGDNTLRNLRPVHGTEPCAVCHSRCNQSRGNRA